MARALTVRAVDAVPAAGTRREIPDGATRGLYLVVQPSGAKGWAYRYRSPIDGRPRKLTLGPYPAFGLRDAREAAAEAARYVARGADPAAAKVDARSRAADRSDLVDVILDHYVHSYVLPKNRASTAAEVQRLIDRNIRPRWGTRKVGTITRRDVVALIDEATSRGASVTANRLLAVVRRFFNWTVERSIVESSPAAAVKAPTDEVSRDRILTDDEIRWLWDATERRDLFDRIVRVLLLTGQRRGEVAGLRRNELVPTGGTLIWTIPGSRTKNGRLHVLPVRGEAATILEASVSNAQSLLFESSARSQFVAWSKAKAALDARMLEAAKQEAFAAGHDPTLVSLVPWRLHDLRRTAASGMARLGQPIHVVEAVLNHASGSISGVAAVYNRYDYLSEKERALQAWDTHVRSVVSGAERTVIPLRA